MEAKTPRWTHTVAPQPSLEAVVKLRVQAFVKYGLFDEHKNEFDTCIAELTEEADGYEAYASKVKSASGRGEQMKKAKLNREVVTHLLAIKEVWGKPRKA